MATGNGGLCCFISGKFKRSISIDKEALDYNYINTIALDNEGILWLGTDNGILRYDGQKIKRLVLKDKSKNKPRNRPKDKLKNKIKEKKKSDFVFDILAEADGKLWIATIHGLLCIQEGRQIQCPLAGALGDQNCRSIYRDKAGRLWVGTLDGTYCYFKGKVTTYRVSDGLAHKYINDLAGDSAGRTWIATWDGLSVWENGKIKNYTIANGLPSNFITQFLFDGEGNAWLGTDEGLTCIRSLNMKTFTNNDGLPDNTVYYIIEDRHKRIWFATATGLSCYVDGKFKNYTTEDGLISNNPLSLMEDKEGNIWISTLEGISVYTGRRFINYSVKQGLASRIVYRTLQTKSGTIWAATRRGLNRFENGTFSLPKKDAPKTALRLLEDSRENLWVGSDTGLYRWAGGKRTHYSAPGVLPENDIQTIYEATNGDIWIGTPEGAVVCSNDGSKETFKTYTTADGLRDNSCKFFVEDSRQNVWIGTPKGLTCFDGTVFKTYTSEAHGLPTSSWYCGFSDSSGRLWFGSAKGLTEFLPPPIRTNSVPPPVYVTGVKILEKEVPISQLGQLDYFRNYIRFDFVGLCLSSPGSVRYQCKLEPIEKEWHLTKERFMFYPYLPHGRYTFRVKAINNDGIYSRETVEVPFTILPPFWRTWWFMGFMGITGFSLLLALVMWRNKRARKNRNWRPGTAN